ncbi:PaaI family thioesterase [Spiribacter halobius]|uniref:Thioesterase n=1 Tax=Sediminicurvatus halobius TaxID=2182432 RepID=A0A2U2MXT2_9GAMM|nr:PaaI family thioesterase [Spiribacter halobius]PWG61583.1 thioesterase [Spiribacter halobius]UEX77153.1 PaaI family thioesterase [Spiribacter halobius]
MTERAPDEALGLARRFFAMLPHSAVLGLEPLRVTAGAVLVRLRWRPELVGNPETEVIHGGVITTLVDQTSGAAVLAALGGPEAIATLDLRIDHLRAARPRQDVIAEATCYRMTRHIAFVRCSIHDGDAAAPVAASMSTFMRLAGGGPSVVEGSE